MPSAELDDAPASTPARAAAPTRGRPGRGRRRTKDDGPRATFGQLLPFLFEHKRTLVVVAVLSVLSAVAMLAQPLLVGLVIERVQNSLPLGMLLWALVGFVIAASLISVWQHYLLQRTGTAVVYSSRRKLIARIFHLPVSEFDARRTGEAAGDLADLAGLGLHLDHATLRAGAAVLGPTGEQRDVEPAALAHLDVGRDRLEVVGLADGAGRELVGRSRLRGDDHGHGPGAGAGPRPRGVQRWTARADPGAAGDLRAVPQRVRRGLSVLSQHRVPECAGPTCPPSGNLC